MLWSNSGKDWQPVFQAREDMGLDAVLCCPGPSLKPIERGLGKKIFGINTSYPIVKPDVWIGMDEMYCYDSNILYEPFIKIFRGTYSESSFKDKKLKHYPETYFADVGEVPAGKTMLDLRGQNVKFAWHKHTLGTSLHIMIWMGARKIYLYGCDLGGDKDYCHDLKLNENHKSVNRRLYDQQVIFLKKLHVAAKDYGINIYSSTPKSPINDFMEYIDINSVGKSYEPSTFRHVLDND